MSTEITKAKKQQTELVITNTDHALHIANELASFIKKNKLCSNIKGKEYVNVEGWSFAGSMLGILPRIEEYKNLSNDTEIKYEVRVNLYDTRNDDKYMGCGIALCSNKEQSKKFFDEYAILSMAQTRAIGKAYRNILAWIIKAAGYETTPYEEMPEDSKTTTATEDQPSATVLEEKEPQKLTEATRKEIVRLLEDVNLPKDKKQKGYQDLPRLTEEQGVRFAKRLNDIISELVEQELQAQKPVEA